MSNSRSAYNQYHTYDTGVEHTGLRIKRVDSGVDTKLSNGTRQDSGSIQVSESSGGSRICQIIGGHIDSLHGSDGTLLGGGNTLLPGEYHKTDIMNTAKYMTYMPPMSVESVG
jgi:hypothetical protein